ncbi:hypothetical protein PsorP6_011526 [Peronosclerospora sorghi]|uniref:Uncharacterized protein n=1 Tax=Peronosclerospora sorghi TaxID=230839 RepID=A0ACC0WHU9_9STRA|nr:hypothetical protein PsorP6_011526 [Peronosclerospora sorghi]
MEASVDAQLYMQIQPYWQLAEGSCWPKFYERTVQNNSASNVDKLAQNDSAVAKIYSCPSFQFQVPLSTSSEPSQAPHKVKILKKSDSWVDVQVNFHKSEAAAHSLPSSSRTIDVPLVSLSNVAEESAPAMLQLNAVDVSKDERFLALGGSNGVGMLWDNKNRTQMLPLQGHVAYITCSRFFPSSQVVFTGSIDFTLPIWSING